MKSVSQNQQDYRLDFSELLSILLRRKWLIILPVIFVSVATYIGLRYVTPEYESSIILLMDRPAKLSYDIRMLIGEGSRGFMMDEDRQMELNAIRNEILSPPVMLALIRKYNLDKSPELDAIAGQMLQTMPNLNVEQVKYDYLVGEFSEKIFVQYAGLNQIKIILRSSDPFLARDYVQTIGENFISEKMKQQRGVIHSTDDFTYDQLERYENDLQDKIDRKTQLQIDYNKIYSENNNFYFDNQNEIKAEINNVKKDIEEFEDRKNLLRGQLAQIQDDSLSLGRSALKSSLQKEITNLYDSYSDLSTKFKWGSSEVLNLKTRLSLKLADLKKEINRQIEQQFEDYAGETKALIKRYYDALAEQAFARESQSALEAGLEKVIEISNRIPRMQAELDQIDREIIVAQDLRDKFKTQQEGSTISLAYLRESKFKIIEPAKVPITPFKPDKKQVLAIGFILGLVIGGSSALLAELLDKSIKKTSELENILGLPILGVIPKIKKIEQHKF
ncbi:MAG: Wzz/FepE/Etk N-terminal domain-containing protein [Candidatus Zixiibacteriota bacterium]